MSPSEDFFSSSTLPTIGDPLILDSEVGESLRDADLEFFNSAIAQGDSFGDSGILDENTLSFPAEGGINAVPSRPAHAGLDGAPSKDAAVRSDNNKRSAGDYRAISKLSSISPEASTQDSASDSSRRFKRKSSSNSSLSVPPALDGTMTEDADMQDWKPDDLMIGGQGPGLDFGSSDYASFGDPMTGNDFDISNSAMETYLDFESAGSSPSPLDTQSHVASVRETPDHAYHMLHRSPAAVSRRTFQHVNLTALKPGKFAHASREASPMSGMATSGGGSPAAFINPSSPSSAGGDFQSSARLNGSPNSIWSSGFGSDTPGLSLGRSKSRTDTSPLANGLASPLSVPRSLSNEIIAPTLTIHPTPLKSRVETQIPIRMSLYPLPQGVTKLHLPAHTISKPKLLAKPPPQRSPDTLELSTMLVCTSAMRSPENLSRAFARAARPESGNKDGLVRRSSATEVDTDADEDKPSNGGEVKICAGCITRERKRAARKKVKKLDEEDSWHQDEHRRVIVFNTHEVKEWQKPYKETILEAEQPPQLTLPEGTMHIDAPMRIACYCRHQNEKLGFQVIFTIKDHEGRLITQAISSSIMITDDHKTHAPLSTVAGQSSIFQDDSQLSSAGVFQAMNAFENHGPAGALQPFRLSHSTTDLQALQHSFNPQFFQQSGFMPTQELPQNTSGTLTPRTLSRQASVSALGAQPSKKRKSSGSAKVPSGLAMTRLEDVQAPNPNGVSSAPANAAVSIGPSPFATSGSSFTPVPDQPYLGHGFLGPSFNTGPPTPNSDGQGYMNGVQRSHSVENLPLHQMFSAPVSSHASRAPSPTAAHMANASVFQQNHAQMAQAVANSIYGIPTALNPHRPPTIHKLIPNEGPKAGGIEVTCLGSGFCQGLEVMFGDTLATTTTYWGDTSLVCLLPPSMQAGPVPVTFKHERQQQMNMQYPSIPVAKPQVVFKYIDDDEQQLLRMALSVLGHKMTGRMEDVRDIARRIVGSGSNSWAPQGSASPPTGSQSRQASTFGEQMLQALDQESTLLRCLDLIDLDDSPNQPRLNLRRPNGQTMLHLASSLGFNRFVAALLARGANPEPRDKNGFTPAHFAAMHGHAQIVRRLILNGADPGMRTLNGYTAADLASSEEVLQAARKVGLETRRRSMVSARSRSRTSSVASFSSLWGDSAPAPAASRPVPLADSELDEDAPSDACSDDLDDHRHELFRASSRSNSARIDLPSTASASAGITGAPFGDLPSPAAGMTAWRAQLAAQLHSLQQQVHLNLPNLQMPTLPPMPTLPDYQAYLPNPMVRRISSLAQKVPHRPGSARGEIDSGKESDYRWWELFSGPSSSPPPAYDEIYPKPGANDGCGEKSGILLAAADAVVNEYHVRGSGVAQASGSSQVVALEGVDVRLGRKPLSEHQQEQLRIAHANKVKRIKYDQRLFLLWIPLLVFVLAMMAKARVPQIWSISVQLAGQVRSTFQQRFVEAAV